MSTLGSPDRPLRVAIIGSGPSGFYAAQALQKAEIACQIDMFDRLPTPFGLVRLGVAPDHPKIKNVTKIYERIATKPDFEFLGNVCVGKDITVAELQRFYDALIFACGAESDRQLGIPGEDLAGSHTATEFVAWYNGHPDYRDHTFDLSQETAVVIGQGNVAVDVCRILSKTVDELKSTDIAQHALDVLAKSRVKNIYMIGRRGPVQAKFTQKEIKEMGRLDDCDPIVDPKELVFDPASQAEYDDPDNKAIKTVVPVLEEFAQRPEPTRNRRLHILFRKSPVALQGSERVERIVLETNDLVGEPFRMKAEGSGVTEELDCGLVFRSVGYRGLPFPGVPFDEEKGRIANRDGRIVDGEAVVSGMYAVGWIKRGPSGVIGTNKPDSQATVDLLLEDIDHLPPCETPDSESLAGLLKERNIRVVTFEDWMKIDRAEIARGTEAGKPREKFTRLDEILNLLDGV